MLLKIEKIIFFIFFYEIIFVERLIHFLFHNEQTNPYDHRDDSGKRLPLLNSFFEIFYIFWEPL